MSRQNQPEHQQSERQNPPHKNTGQQPTLFTSPESQPKTTRLFNIIGTEHRYLPYDPDTIAEQYIEYADYDENATVGAVIEKCEEITGIRFPDIAQVHAHVELQEEHINDEFTILLYLIHAHAKVLQRGNKVLTDKDYPTITNGANREPRPLIAMRVVKQRAHYGAIHLGRTIQHIITHPLSESDQGTESDYNHDQMTQATQNRRK